MAKKRHTGFEDIHPGIEPTLIPVDEHTHGAIRISRAEPGPLSTKKMVEPDRIKTGQFGSIDVYPQNESRKSKRTDEISRTQTVWIYTREFLPLTWKKVLMASLLFLAGFLVGQRVELDVFAPPPEQPAVGKTPAAGSQSTRAKSNAVKRPKNLANMPNAKSTPR